MRQQELIIVCTGLRTCIDHVFAKIASKVKTKVEVGVVHARVTDHVMTCVSVQIDDQVSLSAAAEPAPYCIDYDKLNNLLDNMTGLLFRVK